MLSGNDLHELCTTDEASVDTLKLSKNLIAIMTLVSVYISINLFAIILQDFLLPYRINNLKRDFNYLFPMF